jgi:hypothetical protein
METDRYPHQPSRTARVALTCLLGALTWLAWPRSAAGQLPDLAEVSVGYLPGATIEDHAPASAQVTSYDVAVNAPIPLGKTRFFIPGVTYHADSASFADTAPGFVELRRFHAVDVSLLGVQLLPGDWSVSVRVAPGLAGDFRDLDGRSFRLGAMALVAHAFSPRFVLGGGALVSYQLGSVLPLPAVHVEWKPLRNVQVEAFVPAFAQARWTIAGRVELGVRSEFNGNSYAIGDERIAGAWPCRASGGDVSGTPGDESQARPDECLDHLTYAVGSAGATAGVRLFSSVWLNAFGGHTFFRRLERNNEERDPIPGGVDDLPNVPFFRVGLAWRMPTGADDEGGKRAEPGGDRAARR